MAEASDFKFSTYLRFAKADHKITLIGRAEAAFMSALWYCKDHEDARRAKSIADRL